MKNIQLSLPNVSVNFCFIILLCLKPLFTFAQLGKYEFPGTSTTNNQFNKVTSQPSHTTFSEFTRVGVFNSLGKDFFNTRGWTPGTADYSIYIEFTVTAHPNYTLNLSQLQFETSRSDQGPTQVRVAHNASGSFTTDYLDYNNISNNFQKVIWDFPDIKTSIGGSVTFRIYGLLPLQGTGTLRLDNVALYGITIPQMSINEFHYANTSTTKTGFVEVIAPKDFAELNTATLSLYNGEGKYYESYMLKEFLSLPDSEYGDFKIYYLDFPTGLIDGTGGLSLSVEDQVIQFISYGGTITAVNGPAINITSNDIGVVEMAEDGANNSIALMPRLDRSMTPFSESGEVSGYWEKGVVNNNTKGYANTEPYRVLPVELIYFKAKVKDEGILLNWATATEINNKEFVVERSNSGKLDFTAISTLTGHGTTLQQQQYEYLDAQPFVGTSYYRLKQTDLDGAITYSKVVAVTRKTTTNTLTLYPNPAITFINVSIDMPAGNEDIQVQVIDLRGQIMYQQMYKYLNKSNNLSVPITNLPTGTYYLVIIKDGHREAKAFLKS